MESPQSVYIDGYYKGFHIGVTKRDEDAKVKPLIDAAVAVIEHMISLGFEPSWNKQTSKEALGDEKPVKINPSEEERDADSIAKPGWCPIHRMNMFEKEGPYGKFWSHYVKEESGYCKGYGVKNRPLSSYKPEEI